MCRLAAAMHLALGDTQKLKEYAKTLNQDQQKDLHQSILDLAYRDWRDNGYWSYYCPVTWIGLNYGSLAGFAVLDFIVGLGAVVSAVVTLCVTLTGLGMVTCVLLLPFAPDVVIQVFGWVLPCYVLSWIAISRPGARVPAPSSTP